jgi:hypothetical protein
MSQYFSLKLKRQDFASVPKNFQKILTLVKVFPKFLLNFSTLTQNYRNIFVESQNIKILLSNFGKVLPL